MSVQQTQYIGYGYMLDYEKARAALIELYGEDGYESLSEKYSDNAFSDDITEVHGCSMIEDGMNGEFTFFGKIFVRSRNYGALPTMAMPEITERVRIITEHELLRVFGELFNADKPQHYLITLYR